MMNSTILSGAQPSADSLHIGNFLGAVKNWVQLQESYDALYFIADLHAITVKYDQKVLAQRTRITAAQYLAAGVDPEKSILFVQSQVPEHAQLAWVFSCITSFGEASRMTQFKDKSSKDGGEDSRVGLFTYPILMAADILLYRPHLVPVGEDQKQHLELSRRLAQRFNVQFGDTFVLPEGYVMDGVAKVYDLQNPMVKMSKSSVSPAGTLNLLDDVGVNTKKIMSAVTDVESEVRFDRLNKPGVSNLLNIYSAFSGVSIVELEGRYSSCGYGGFKKDLAEVVADFSVPFAARVAELLADSVYLDSVLADGAVKARERASRSLADVYSKVGFLFS